MGVSTLVAVVIIFLSLIFQVPEKSFPTTLATVVNAMLSIEVLTVQLPSELNVFRLLCYLQVFSKSR